MDDFIGSILILCLAAALFIAGGDFGMRISRDGMFKAGAIEYYLDDNNTKQWRPVTKCTGE